MRGPRTDPQMVNSPSHLPCSTWMDLTPGYISPKSGQEAGLLLAPSSNRLGVHSWPSCEGWVKNYPSPSLPLCATELDSQLGACCGHRGFAMKVGACKSQSSQAAKPPPPLHSAPSLAQGRGESWLSQSSPSLQAGWSGIDQHHRLPATGGEHSQVLSPAFGNWAVGSVPTPTWNHPSPFKVIYVSGHHHNSDCLREILFKGHRGRNPVSPIEIQ